jgi:hypothetical protein
MDPCNQDCFFDGNSGAGNDGCVWNLKCDPLSPGDPSCPYDAGYNNCDPAQPQKCIDNCDVPNGCDCFGCCTVEYMGTSYDVFIGDPTCNLGNIPSCNPCTKNTNCDNPCDEMNCEVCFGQDEPPMGCGEPTCPMGVDPCLMDSDCTGMNMFCQTGCCTQLPT